MGIKYFFKWFKTRFEHHIKIIKPNAKANASIDNFMIDLNGVFHPSAQKIYKYGNFKPMKRILGTAPIEAYNEAEREKECFQDICDTIDYLVQVVKPKKRLILCVDGSAPLSKQNQQRCRRFLSAKTRDETQLFDSNCITTGTGFMDRLSAFIYAHIQNILKTYPELEIIFSDEKVPGEGEHKCVIYMRRYGNKKESFCINGMDADLIMLSLGTHFPYVYILRDEPYLEHIKYYLVNIGEIRKELYDLMKWEGENFHKIKAINDFILICFIIANDFLPHIPGMEIGDGGALLFSTFFDIYKTTCKNHGHLTTVKKGKNEELKVRIRKKSLQIFFAELALFEKETLENKLLNKSNYFEDEILENNTDFRGHKPVLDIQAYRKDYYKKYFKDAKKKHICKEYIQGMQWVLSYYTQGIPNWLWRYTHYYAPFSYDIARYMLKVDFHPYYEDEITIPSDPFLQLVCVLPPKSANLIPEPLNTLVSHESEIAEFYPRDFEIDLAGKKQEWEGVIILPFVNVEKVRKVYQKKVKKVKGKELERNIVGTSWKFLVNGEIE